MGVCSYEKSRYWRFEIRSLTIHFVIFLYFVYWFFWSSIQIHYSIHSSEMTDAKRKPDEYYRMKKILGFEPLLLAAAKQILLEKPQLYHCLAKVKDEDYVLAIKCLSRSR